MTVSKNFLSLMKVKPRLIVFDLDETLWPFGIDQFIMKPPYKNFPPYKKFSSTQGSVGQVLDSEGKKMDPFPESNQVLEQIHSAKVLMAAASRTTYPEGADSLIQLFGWSNYFKFKEIYPGSKTDHFKKLNQKSKIPLKEMLFFDNEERNLIDVEPLGVTCVLVDSKTGVKVDTLREGVEKWLANQ